MASLHVLLGLTVGVFVTGIHISGDDLDAGPGGEDPFKTGNVIVEFGGSGMRIQVQNAQESGGAWSKHGEFHSDYISNSCGEKQKDKELKHVTLGEPLGPDFKQDLTKCLKKNDGKQRIFVKNQEEADKVVKEVQDWAKSIKFEPRCDFSTQKCVGIPQVFVSGGYLAKYMEFVSTEEGKTAEPEADKFAGNFNDIDGEKPVPHWVQYIANQIGDFKVDMDEALLESIAFDQWMQTAEINSKPALKQKLKDGKYLWLTAGSTTAQLVMSSGKELKTIEQLKKTETYNMLATQQAEATKKMQKVAPSVPADTPIVLWNHLASLLVQMGPNMTFNNAEKGKPLTGDKFAVLAFPPKGPTTDQMYGSEWVMHEMTFGAVVDRVEYLKKATPVKNYDFGYQDDGTPTKGKNVAFKNCIQWKAGVILLDQALQAVNVPRTHPVFVTKNGVKGPDLGAAILKSDAKSHPVASCDKDKDGTLTKEELAACSEGEAGSGQSEDPVVEDSAEEDPATTAAPVKTSAAPVKTEAASTKK
jgi:hypothetical protein